MDITPLIDWAINQSVPLVILLGIGWFIVRKVWPWLTEVYLPGRQQMDALVSENMVLIARHLENASVALNHFADKCRQALEKDC